MKKISLNNYNIVLYSLARHVRKRSLLTGAEAPVHLLIAGTSDDWNLGLLPHDVERNAHDRTLNIRSWVVRDTEYAQRMAYRWYAVWGGCLVCPSLL
jgi:hypothetical protein